MPTAMTGSFRHTLLTCLPSLDPFPLPFQDFLRPPPTQLLSLKSSARGLLLGAPNLRSSITTVLRTSVEGSWRLGFLFQLFTHSIHTSSPSDTHAECDFLRTHTSGHTRPAWSGVSFGPTPVYQLIGYAPLVKKWKTWILIQHNLCQKPSWLLCRNWQADSLQADTLPPEPPGKAYKGSGTAKTILKKNNKVGGLILAEFKIRYKVTVIKTVWYCTGLDVWIKDLKPKVQIHPCIYGRLTFDNSVKVIQWKKHSLFNNDARTTWYPHAKECSWTLTSHHKQKFTQNGSKT